MTLELKIEKNIPIPSGRPKHQRPSVFRSMEVGDSVFLERPVEKAHSYYKPIAKSLGWKFTARSVDGGTRIWRIA